jgi:hypothetical protein
VTDPQWADTTVLSGDLAGAVGELKAKPGGDVQVHGSGRLIRWLLANDLVDEITLLVCPVVIGQGTLLFPDTGPDVALDLLESRTTSKGVTIQIYRPTGRPHYETRRSTRAGDVGAARRRLMPMPRYLISVWFDGDFPDSDPSDPEYQRVDRQIGALNEEMESAGVRMFVAGLKPASTATVLRPSGSEVSMTDAPYAETKEQRRRALAGRRRAPQPRRLDHHDRPQPGHRPAAA